MPGNAVSGCGTVDVEGAQRVLRAVISERDQREFVGLHIYARSVAVENQLVALVRGIVGRQLKQRRRGAVLLQQHGIGSARCIFGFGAQEVLNRVGRSRFYSLRYGPGNAVADALQM